MRPSHTTNTIKFDRIPFDPGNSIKRFDLCPFEQKNSTYLQLIYPSIPFLRPTSAHPNLNNFKPKQLQPQKRVQNEKKKQRRPEPRKHTKDPPIAPLFFGTEAFFETFWIAPKGPPSFVSIFCILHFRHCDTVQKSHFKKYFGKFFPPSIYFLQPPGVSQSPKGPPFQF